MRKIILGLTSTVSGVVLLFSYHTSLNRAGEPTALGGGNLGGNLGGSLPTETTPDGDPTSSAPDPTGEPTEAATDGDDDATDDESTPTPTGSASDDTDDDDDDDDDGGATTKAPAGGSTRTTTKAAAKPTTARATTKKVTTAPAKPSGTFTGTTVTTRWGPVQVQIRVENGRITAAAAVQYPTGNPKNDEINSVALPILNREVVSAQSARIDGVSGATVTSDGYRQSLQSAIDKAGL